MVKEGRFEFICGGMSQHDELTTHYEDQINNMLLGHEFLLKEFGVRPRVGWQVDPFGHSSANARLFSEMGFDGFFFGRVDYLERFVRMDEQSLEYLWRPQFKHFGTKT